jgi:hypothetical protein
MVLDFRIVGLVNMRVDFDLFWAAVIAYASSSFWSVDCFACSTSHPESLPSWFEYQDLSAISPIRTVNRYTLPVSSFLNYLMPICDSIIKLSNGMENSCWIGSFDRKKLSSLKIRGAPVLRWQVSCWTLSGWFSPNTLFWFCSITSR